MATQDRRERYDKGGRTIKKSAQKRRTDEREKAEDKRTDKEEKEKRDTAYTQAELSKRFDLKSLEGQRWSGVGTGPHTRIVDGYALTEEGYQRYLEVEEKDPGHADEVLKNIGVPLKDLPKSEEHLKKGESESDKKSIEEQDTFERRFGLGPHPGSANVAEEQARTKERRILEESRFPAYDKDKGRGNLGPSQRRGRTAATEFMQANGVVSAVVPPNVRNWDSVNVPSTAPVWMGSTGGVAAPGRGHMNDPDAPGGRTAPRETDKLVSIAQAFREIDDIRIWTSAKVAKFQADQGLTVTGVVGDNTRLRWLKVLEFAASKYSKGEKVSPYALFSYRYDADKPISAGGPPGPGEPGGGPRTSVQTVMTNRGVAKKLLNQLFRAGLGRGVTEDEVSKFQSMLNEQEKKHPVTTTTQYDTTGAEGSTTQSGGMDAEQYGEDYMRSVMGGDVNARTVGVNYFDAALDAIGAALH
jgi:hypothetical protein